MSEAEKTLKVYYIDAENVNNIDVINSKLKLQILDKIFIFSRLKNKILDESCSYITEYPKGKNQADFCIIAHLSKVLAELSQSERHVFEFILFSKDIELWVAFEFQCKKSNVKVRNPFIEDEEKTLNKLIIQPSIMVKQDSFKTPYDIKKEVLKLITQEPVSAKQIADKLKINPQDISACLTRLKQEKIIERLDNMSTKWTVSKIADEKIKIN